MDMRVWVKKGGGQEEQGDIRSKAEPGRRSMRFSGTFTWMQPAYITCPQEKKVRRSGGGVWACEE